MHLNAIIKSIAGGSNSAHAYIVEGRSGSGRDDFIKKLSMGLECRCVDISSRPCGVCDACRQVAAGSSMDIVRMQMSGKTAYKTEDANAFSSRLDMGAYGRYLIGIIDDADSLSETVQNKLLKTLEEPPPDTCIILVTDHTESLLTTVISRCRILRIKAWNDEYILSVLEDRGIPRERAREAVAASNGSVGKALELSSDESYWKLRDEVLKCFFDATSRSDVLKISNQWKDRKQEAEEIFSILEFFVKRITESRFGERKTDLSFLPEQWQRFSERAGKENFVLLMETIANAKRQLQFSTNFQAVLEKIIFVFMGEGNVWLQ